VTSRVIENRVIKLMGLMGEMGLETGKKNITQQI
jgi:hypothetical protein